MRPFDLSEVRELSRVEILEAVAMKHGFTLTEVRSKFKTKAAQAARQEAVYAMSLTNKWSAEEIGAVVGCTQFTVFHILRRYLQSPDCPVSKLDKVFTVEGNMDALRRGLLSIQGVRRNYVFCRLTGSVTLYQMDPQQANASYDRNKARIEAARRLLTEHIGVVGC